VADAVIEARAGTLPAMRYGRLWRVRQGDLLAFGQVLTKSTPATQE
jgi:hypothetical protein